MRAGRLRYLVTVEEPQETKNTVGEVVTTFIPVGKEWAAIDPIRGEERYTLNQAKAVVDTKITMRANAAPYLTPKHRIVYKTRVFDIDANIDWQSRGIMRELYCKEAA